MAWLTNKNTFCIPHLKHMSEQPIKVTKIILYEFGKWFGKMVGENGCINCLEVLRCPLIMICLLLTFSFVTLLASCLVISIASYFCLALLKKMSHVACYFVSLLPVGLLCYLIGFYHLKFFGLLACYLVGSFVTLLLFAALATGYPACTSLDNDRLLYILLDELCQLSSFFTLFCYVWLLLFDVPLLKNVGLLHENWLPACMSLNNKFVILLTCYFATLLVRIT